jgi:phosphoribosylcarboxyaminoimidazole (NCAIR) mutase
MTSPPIGIIMGSDSDLPTMQDAIAQPLGAVVNYDYTPLAARVSAPSLFVGTSATMLIPQAFKLD